MKNQPRQEGGDSFGEDDTSSSTPWLIAGHPDDDCSAVRQIADGSMPILSAFYDQDVGEWCFMTDEEVLPEDRVEARLGLIVKGDPSLLGLADLPPGWLARRDSKRSRWIYESIPEMIATYAPARTLSRKDSASNRPIALRLLVAIIFSLAIGFVFFQLGYSGRMAIVLATGVFLAVGFVLVVSATSFDEGP